MVARGVVEHANHDGEVAGAVAVPGAEVRHFKKKVNNGAIFRATFQSKRQLRY